MNNKKVQLIVMNAMIGAAYAVLTILISPIAYGAVQMRLTEIIVLLACYNKKFIPDIIVRLKHLRLQTILNLKVGIVQMKL